MANLKKLTILHSNDLHGDFLAEEIDSKLVGGVSMLSGYVNKVRNEEKNVSMGQKSDLYGVFSSNHFTLSASKKTADCSAALGD